MNINTVSFKRRTILGELYKQCDAINSIPVYINDQTAAPVGTVDESLDHYADAFLFHLPNYICKKLLNNSYDIGVDYDFANKNKVSYKDRIKVNHIILAIRKEAEPMPRRSSRRASATAA